MQPTQQIAFVFCGFTVCLMSNLLPCKQVHRQEARRILERFLYRTTSRATAAWRAGRQRGKPVFRNFLFASRRGCSLDTRTAEVSQTRPCAGASADAGYCRTQSRPYEGACWPLEVKNNVLVLDKTPSTLSMLLCAGGRLKLTPRPEADSDCVFKQERRRLKMGLLVFFYILRINFERDQ